MNLVPGVKLALSVKMHSTWHKVKSFRIAFRRPNRFHSGQPQPNPTSSETPAEEKMTLKVLWTRYGSIAICTHFSLYLVTLAGLTGLVNYGVLGNSPEEREEAIEKVATKIEPYVPTAATEAVRTSPFVGAFAIAWITAKFTEPIRLVCTMFLVPRIARRLGRAPPLTQPSKASVKKL